MKQYLKYAAFAVSTLLLSLAIIAGGFSSAKAQGEFPIGNPKQPVHIKGHGIVDSTLKVLGLKNSNGDTYIVTTDAQGKFKLIPAPTGGGSGMDYDTLVYYATLDTLAAYWPQDEIVDYLGSAFYQLQQFLVHGSDSAVFSLQTGSKWVSKYYADSILMKKDRTITIDGLTKKIKDNPSFTTSSALTSGLYLTSGFVDVTGGAATLLFTTDIGHGNFIPDQVSCLLIKKVSATISGLINIGWDIGSSYTELVKDGQVGIFGAYSNQFLHHPTNTSYLLSIPENTDVYVNVTTPVTASEYTVKFIVHGHYETP